MAEKKNDQEEPENGSGQPDDSSNSSENGAPALGAKTLEVLVKFQEDCKVKKEAAEADSVVAQTNLANAMQVACSDHRAWRKGVSSRTFYSQLHYNVANGLSADMDKALKCVEEHIKASEEIVTAHDEAISKMKEACVKLENVCRVAKDLDTATNKTSNVSHKDEINTILEKKNRNVQEFDKITASFKQRADDLQNMGDQLIETAVKATGVYSFVNVESLKACVEDLIKFAGDFKAETEKNQKTSEDNIKAALKNVADGVSVQSEAFFGRAKADAKAGAIGQIYENLNTRPPQTPMVPKYSMDNICKHMVPVEEEKKPERTSKKK